MSLVQATNPLVGSLTARDTEMADLGASFTVQNVPGTALSGPAAATTFDQTKAILYFINLGPQTVYPTSFRAQLTNAGTAGTSMRMEFVVDKGPDRYSSSGTAFSPVSTNPLGAIKSGIGSVYLGSTVLKAANSSSVVADALFRAVIGVVGDNYAISFGVPEAQPLSSVTTLGAAVANVAFVAPPVAVPPNCIFAIHQWSGSQSGAYQWDGIQFDWFER